MLGFGWSVVGPVTFMLVFTLFFGRAGHFNTGGAPYPLFSYIALVPWTFFAEALTLGSVSLISNLTLLNKVYCPREVFPIATILWPPPSMPSCPPWCSSCCSRSIATRRR